MSETEADTCRKYVLPNLYQAGWTDEQINEQHTFTDGRIIPTSKKIRRGPQKRADYRLRLTRDFPIAIVEAKASYKTAGDGLQQAKDYAKILGLKFAYATNGKEIIEFDFLTGQERKIDHFPGPNELWRRLKQGAKLSDQAGEQLLTPYFHQPKKEPRYYQQIAINRVIEAILQGCQRVLQTMATGTGKAVRCGVGGSTMYPGASARPTAPGTFPGPGNGISVSARRGLTTEPLYCLPTIAQATHRSKVSG
jgi:type I restriction enzyme R subunit